MRPIKITAETTETLKRERGNGATYADIAARTGVSAKYLSQVAVELGLGRKQFVWTDEAHATLRDLWNQGLSASQIARRMGGGVSRSAVLGKVHRMGLATRTTKTTRVYQDPKTKLARRSAAAKKARRTRERLEESRALDVAAVIVPPEEAPLGATTLADMRNDQCRWPYGDGPFTFCPEVRVPFASYCLGHQHKAYQPGTAMGPGSRKQ